jgi:membrane protein YdbS with pleckstrin-like domain
MILPFVDGSPLEGVWAVVMVSLFLMIVSVVVALVWRDRAGKLERLESGEELLAEWILDSEQKRRYIEHLYESSRAKNMVILTIMLFWIVLIFGGFVLFMDEGRWIMGGVAVGLIAVLTLFAYGMPRYYRRSNLKSDGRIMIGVKYASINGYLHNWDYPLSGLSSIRIIQEPFYGIQLVYYYTDRTLRHTQELTIPANKDIDLNQLVKQLKELNS